MTDVPSAFSVATALSCTSKRWKNQQMTWKKFCDWQREPRRTDETISEYAAMTKAEKDRVKNGACYVAGQLKEGKRGKDTVISRSMVVLDADHADSNLWEDYLMLIGARACMYPTHSHTEASQKYRLVIPLARVVTPEEYVPLALKIAEILGLNRFDPTTYQPSRLMYKSSCSHDADFNFNECPSTFLDPGQFLALYSDWRDASSWPVVANIARSAGRATKAQDPREKKGVIGAFCRSYSIDEAIAEFLSDTYEPCGNGRYTYRGGSAYGGAVSYEGLWLYSNHATDPASGQLLNAFDLVRVHRFGSLDEDAGENTAVTALPSYKAAVSWMLEIEQVSLELARAKVDSTIEDFSAEMVDDSWLAKLAKDVRTGEILATAGNLKLIFEKDVNLADKLRRDVESDTIYVVADRLPWRMVPEGCAQWRDGDDANLRIYLETKYGIAHKAKVDDALSASADAHPFDPLSEYLANLPAWDGKPRADSLLIDFMGAEDSAYTRAVTRKMLCAAVRRAKCPGCKFDHMLILEGDQGLGKSTILSKLAGNWFTDSLTLTDIGDPKTAGEKIQGNWICEVAELDGMAKTSIERLKGFLSTPTDNYRAAYARRARKYRRRCIIVGTVNNLDGYLRDATGNRRFWPVRVTRQFDQTLLDTDTVSQIWAETQILEATGEKLYLEGALEISARKKQREAMETDPRESRVKSYLDTPIPEGFSFWSLGEREDFWSTRSDFDESESGGLEGVIRRESVSVIEIWHECLAQPTTKPTRKDSYELAAILKKLGWEPTGRVMKLRAYGDVKWYERGKDEKPRF